MANILQVNGQTNGTPLTPTPSLLPGSLNTAMLTPAGTQAGTTFAVGLENTPLGNVSSFASGTPMYMLANNNWQVQQIVCQATPGLLVQYGNSAFINLQADLVTLRAAHEQLKLELSTSRDKLRITREMFETLTRGVSLREQYRNTADPTILTLIDIMGQQDDKKYCLLTQEECPDVKFYRQEDWLAWKSKPQPVGSVHSQATSHAAKKNLNVMMNFLETIDGVAINGSAAKDIRSVARTILAGLADLNIAPPSWGKVNRYASNIVYRELRSKYEVFRYCEGNWKARKFIRIIYPNWYSNYFKNKASSPVGAAAADIDYFQDNQDDESDNDTDPNTIHQAVNNAEDSNGGNGGDMTGMAGAGTPTMNSAHTSSTGVSQVRSVQSTQVVADPLANLSFDDVPTPAADTNTGNIATEDSRPATTTGDAIDTQDDFIPTAATNAKEDAMDTQDDTNVQDGPLGNTASASPAAPDALPVSPANGTTEPSSGTDATKKIRKKRGTAAPYAKTSAKEKKAVPTQALGPKNLCMQEWVKSNENGTKAEFDTYYKGLTGNEQKHWKQVAKEQKAATAVAEHA